MPSLANPKVRPRRRKDYSWNVAIMVIMIQLQIYCGYTLLFQIQSPLRICVASIVYSLSWIYLSKQISRAVFLFAIPIQLFCMIALPSNTGLDVHRRLKRSPLMDQMVFLFCVLHVVPSLVSTCQQFWKRYQGAYTTSTLLITVVGNILIISLPFFVWNDDRSTWADISAASGFSFVLVILLLLIFDSGNDAAFRLRVASSLVSLMAGFCAQYVLSKYVLGRGYEVLLNLIVFSSPAIAGILTLETATCPGKSSSSRIDSPTITGADSHQNFVQLMLKCLDKISKMFDAALLHLQSVSVGLNRLWSKKKTKTATEKENCVNRDQRIVPPCRTNRSDSDLTEGNAHYHPHDLDDYDSEDIQSVMDDWSSASAASTRPGSHETNAAPGLVRIGSNFIDRHTLLDFLRNLSMAQQIDSKAARLRHADQGRSTTVSRDEIWSQVPCGTGGSTNLQSNYGRESIMEAETSVGEDLWDTPGQDSEDIAHWSLATHALARGTPLAQPLQHCDLFPSHGGQGAWSRGPQRSGKWQGAGCSS